MVVEVDNKFSVRVFGGSAGCDYFKKIVNFICFQADISHTTADAKRGCVTGPNVSFTHCIPFTQYSITLLSASANLLAGNLY
jgi:hypothetical protein